MASTPRIRVEKVTIPTYQLGPADRNPYFFAGRGYQGAKGPVYPYPMLDALSDEKVDRKYEAVYLDNEYVEICVLPEVGGRIFTALDRTNGYDFFYRQSVIKPSLIGMAGAWISGGAEWNLPHHHRPSTFMPVDCLPVENADGSRTLWVGETELRHRMRWAIGITLRPGSSCVEITGKLFNRTPFVHSMLYFTNASVHVNPSYQVIFPPDVEFGTQHAKCEFVRWPISHEVYSGVDYTDGVDVSYWDNHPNWLSIFAFESRQDFFGGYDHERGAGVVHVADHHTSPGKKLFTFSGGPPGATWDSILTDEDGPYLELMAGAFSDNQPDYSWIQPFETKMFTEWWYPIRGLGGIKNATVEAAVNLDISEGGAARVAFNASALFDDATVTVKAGDRLLLEERILIGPESPFAREVALPEGTSPESVKVALFSAEGRELVSYRPRKRTESPLPPPVVPPAEPEKIETSEELYLAGSRLEQFHSPALEPYAYYEEAVRRDAGDYRANTALAVLYLKRGMYEKAEKLLRMAVGRVTTNYTRPRDGEGHYYLGVALRSLGDVDGAREQYNRAAWSMAFRAASHEALAEMAIAEGDLAGALESIEESIAHNALNAKAWCLKAAALRHAGRAGEAVDAARRALELNPLDFFAARDMFAAKRALGDASAQDEADRLSALMRDDAQSHIELAWDYGGCGLYAGGVEVLGRLASRGAAHPMVHYTLGYFYERLGDVAAARREYARGAAAAPDYCFPLRLESVRVLEAAVKADPADARAPYYLGNLLCDIQPERAIEAWEKSRELDGGFATVHRNLAFAYDRHENDAAKAALCIARAIECDGGDALFFFEQDVILAKLGTDHEKRLGILESNARIVSRRDDAMLRKAMLMTLVGRCCEAIEIMDKRHFHIWEGGENSAHAIYADAHLGRGRSRLSQEDARGALEDFEAAAEYPARLEMGEPHDGGREAEFQYMIAMAREAQGDGQRARSALEKAVGREKPGTYLGYYQGLAWRRLGEDKKAAELFDSLGREGRRLLETEPDVDFFQKFGAGASGQMRKAEGHYLTGLGLLGGGDEAKARLEFAEALRLNVNHLGARVMSEEMP